MERKSGQETILLSKSRTRVISIKLEEKIVEALDRCKAKKGLMHRTEVIRQAIKLYLELEGCT